MRLSFLVLLIAELRVCLAVGDYLAARHVDNLLLRLSNDSSFSGALNDEHISVVWKAYKEMFKKTFVDKNHEEKRFNEFTANAKRIYEHNTNAKNLFKLGFNAYSDMSPIEMKSTLNGLRYTSQLRSAARKMFKRNSFTRSAYSSVHSDDDVHIDWRDKGAVTEVKDQGACGSCYSFSATGALEGAIRLAGHRLSMLSEQQILDCSSAWGNHGCYGGLMDFCFQYIIDNKGIDSEHAYPYETQESLCRFNRSNVAAKLVTFTDILPEGDEQALLEALQKHGPISIGIDASSPSFMSYRSGVYVDAQCSSEALDHGVLLVGAGFDVIDVYNETVKVPYWLVKNSWSSSWGDKGYIKMARNKENMCGVATAASFPNV